MILTLSCKIANFRFRTLPKFGWNKQEGLEVSHLVNILLDHILLRIPGELSSVTMYSTLPVLKSYLKNSQIYYQKKRSCDWTGTRTHARIAQASIQFYVCGTLCVTGNSIFGEFMFIRPSHNFLENWWIKHSLEKHHTTSFIISPQDWNNSFLY